MVFKGFIKFTGLPESKNGKNSHLKIFDVLHKEAYLRPDTGIVSPFTDNWEEARSGKGKRSRRKLNYAVANAKGFIDEGKTKKISKGGKGKKKSKKQLVVNEHGELLTPAELVGTHSGASASNGSQAAHSQSSNTGSNSSSGTNSTGSTESSESGCGESPQWSGNMDNWAVRRSQMSPMRALKML